jgi:hypothetical protein
MVMELGGKWVNKVYEGKLDLKGVKIEVDFLMSYEGEGEKFVKTVNSINITPESDTYLTG